MVKANFKVTGMDCASCSMAVKKAVKAVDGVSDAQVSFAAGTMSVEYDPRKAGAQQIREAVKKAGYDTAV